VVVVFAARNIVKSVLKKNVLLVAKKSAENVASPAEDAINSNAYRILIKQEFVRVVKEDNFKTLFT
jgi:hypothetical protein